MSYTSKPLPISFNNAHNFPLLVFLKYRSDVVLLYRKTFMYSELNPCILVLQEISFIICSLPTSAVLSSNSIFVKNIDSD